jgi:hypothetical protein
MNRPLLALLLGALFSGFPVSAGAQQAPSAEQLAVQWLQCGQQRANGQIGPDSDNPIARSSELVVGLAAMGQDAASLSHGGASLADFLKASVSTDVGTNGELLLARAIEPSTGLTAPVIAQLTAAKSLAGDTAGEYGGSLFADALAILGLRAAGQPVGDDSIRFLRSHQNPQDHGWSFDNAGAYGSDSNTTALVIQALIAAGVHPDDAAIQGGMGYLGTQFVNGGFVSFGTTPDPQSDELGIQAIVATSSSGDSTWGPRLESALNDLRQRQIASGADQGAFAAFDKLMATTPAPAALRQRPLTQTGVAQVSEPLIACPAAAVTPTPSPSPSHRATARLAQTGSAPVLPAIAGIFLTAAGLRLYRRGAWR